MQDASNKILSIVKRSTIFSIGNFVNKLILFSMVPLFAWYIAPEDLAILEILDPFEQFLFALLQLGILNAFYKQYQQNEDPAFRIQLVSTGFWFCGLVCLIALILFGFFADFFINILLDSHPLARTCYYLMLFGLVFRMYNAFAYGYYQVHKKAGAIVIWTIVGTVIYCLMNVAGLMFMDGNIDVVFWARLFLLAPMIVAAFFLFKSELAFRFNAPLLGRMLKFSLPFVLTGASYLILNFFDRWMLQDMVDSEATGIYGLSYRFGMIPGMILVAPFLKAWMPAMYETGTAETRETVYKKILLYYTVAGCILWLGLSVFSSELLTIFATDAYYPGHVIIPYIAASQFFYGLGWIVVAGLAYNEKTLSIGVITLLAAISNIVLNWYLIPVFGILGAAFATLLAFLILFLGFAILSQLKLPTNWPWLRLILLAVGAILAYVMISMIGFHHLWWGIVVKSLILIPACLMLLAIAGLTPGKLMIFLKKYTSGDAD